MGVLGPESLTSLADQTNIEKEYRMSTTKTLCLQIESSRWMASVRKSGTPPSPPSQNCLFPLENAHPVDPPRAFLHLLTPFCNLEWSRGADWNRAGLRKRG